MSCYSIVNVLVINILLLANGEAAVRKKTVGNKVRNFRKYSGSFDASSDSDYYFFLKASEEKSQDQNCWMTLNAGKHIQAMEDLEEQYADAREDFRKAIEQKKIIFDEMVIGSIIESRGKVSSLDNGLYDIPAGLNLGGYCMMRMPESLLFFQRVKLRNNTRFRINSLTTDLHEMRVKADLSLNDLHLHGNYERAWNPPGSEDPSELYYVPTYGLADILLQDVGYKLEGRLRLIGNDNLYIVLTNSELTFPNGIMTYKNNLTHSNTNEVNQDNIADFLDRMKSDLDEWLRDYLNEHLVFFSVHAAMNSKVREYHKRRNAELNNYVEKALLMLKKKIRQINAQSIKLPNFRIMSSVDFRLSDGVLRGLDSIYRRSVATGGVEGNIRKVDAIVGFSNLKAQYKYTATVSNGMPPLSGLLILSADDLATHMSINLVKEPESVDLNFDFIHQLKPESLTVEGPANRMIANYKHLLEHHIISIMSSGIYHNVRELRTLVKCQPGLYGRAESGEKHRKPKSKSSEMAPIQSDSESITLKLPQERKQKQFAVGSSDSNEEDDSENNGNFGPGGQLSDTELVESSETSDDK